MRNAKAIIEGKKDNSKVRLHKLLDMKGLTQKEFMDKYFIGKGFTNAIAPNSKTPLSSEMARKIEESLKGEVTADWLLCETPFMNTEEEKIYGRELLHNDLQLFKKMVESRGFTFEADSISNDGDLQLIEEMLPVIEIKNIHEIDSIRSDDTSCNYGEYRIIDNTGNRYVIEAEQVEQAIKISHDIFNQLCFNGKKVL